MIIQRYQQSVAPTKQVSRAYSLPGERRNPILKKDTSHIKYQAGMSMANAVTNISAKIQEAERAEQYTAGETAAMEEYANLIMDVKTGKDWQELTTEDLLSKYEDRALKAENRIMANVKNPDAKRQMKESLAKMRIRGRIQAQDIGWKRQVDRGRAKTHNELERLIDQVVSGMDPQQAMETAEKNVAEKVSVGYFSAQEGQRMLEGFNEQAGQVFFTNLIDINPSAAFAMLSDDKRATYLDGEVRQKMLSAAKTAAHQQQTDAVADQVEAQLTHRFRGNAERAVAWLENPNNFSKVPRDVRKELHGIFKARANRNRDLAEEAKGAAARRDKETFFGLLNEDPVKAASFLERSDLPEETKYNYREKFETSPKKWKTSDPVYAELAEKVMAFDGSDKERESLIDEINDTRGPTLSNIDADKLIGQIPKIDEKPKFVKTLAYAKEKFKKVFAAKDDLDVHLKWKEFVLDMGDTLESEEDAKGRPLTEREQVEIVDAWIYEQTEDIGQFGPIDICPFDRKTRPWEQKGQPPAGRKPTPAPAKGRDQTPADDPLGLFSNASTPAAGVRG